MTDIGPKRPTVKRTVFSTPRSAEFLEVRALQAQTGQPAEDFGHVVVKELLDNALDAAESANRAPVVDIAARVNNYREITFVTVTDNGAGIPSEVVARLCDFTMLVSDKARYRGPTRGAQGNAFKTLLGIPYALGVDEPVVIESAGVRHELRMTLGRVGDVIVEHKASASDHTVGASVTVPLPAHLEVDAVQWAYNAALVNPHATIHAIEHGQSGDDDDAEYDVLYKSAGQAWSKWTPSQPSSPYWYDLAAFSALVHTYIHEAANRPLGRFISEFDGLTRSAKQTAVRRAVPGVTHLSDLDGRDDLIAKLHDAMLHHAKPTVPKKLGLVGEDHLRRLLDDRYGLQQLWYKSTEIDVDGIPWVFEVAVADTVEPGHTWFGCNHAPAFDDPLKGTWLEAGSVYADGAVSFLAGADIKPLSHHAVVIHVICAAAEFTDKGKVELVVPDPVADRIAVAMRTATSVLRKEAELRRKNARKAEQAEQRRREAAAKEKRQNQRTLKDIVFGVLPEAKAAAGHIVAIRTLYYKVRPLVQKHTNKELDYDYFSQQLLPEYQRGNKPLEGLYYEARGELHHPHDGTVTPLGTREVEAYKVPEWQFDKVLFVEKMGLEAQLAPYQLGQKYDMAIIYGKGYAVTACRELLARNEFRDMKIFVLHDADKDGYNIARTLGEETARMPDHNIEVIELGLTVPQAIEHELEIEYYYREGALPTNLVLDDEAREWFTGEEYSRTEGKDGKIKIGYKCTRCELNAFSSDGLADFIEAGLQRHGATAKLVPPADVLAEHVRDVRDEALTDLVWQELAGMVDIAAVGRQLIADHPALADVDEARIRDTFTDDPTRSWRSSAQQLVHEDIDATDGLADAVRAQLAEQLSTSQDD